MTELTSSNPGTGAEVGRFPVADPPILPPVIEAGRAAQQWWAELGFAQRRRRLLRFRALLAERMTEAADLVSAETGKPTAEAVVEVAAAIGDLDWSARHARRVLAPRRVRRVLPVAEGAAHLAYLPYGVVGVIGPWNYPVLTPVASLASALAAGNAVVFKPSELTPAVGQWLADRFAEVVPEAPVLQVIHGDGEVGAALCRSGVDKLSFTGSTATGRRVLEACAETLTPVVLEAGGKDAMIVDSDADLAAAADACVWGGLTNAGQTCAGIERVYVAAEIYDDFLDRVVAQASGLTVGTGPGADLGPITLPRQLPVIREQIADALARGAQAVLGGLDAVAPPYVHPTILVDVPAEADVAQEETFGPVLVVTPVPTMAEAVRLANQSRYGLGAAVFGRRRALAIAGQLRTGMVSVNDVLSFAGMSSLPWGGVGASGFGRVRGDDGLREFARPKSVVVRQAPSLVPSRTFRRTDRDVARLVALYRRWFGRPMR
ncbi:aldehyde dehydrogenase family protein [Natronosporangium hydrolyticum]|uniref:Aldehyde dehydrogenase n=1 Tax=Natronosporangium hydrolyticum TaxID=2811111 RepID=A0A895YMF8_9ACTN|nr:aldehyde dehydrogenase family protein [Natronosporangium hydrolyticum]QSB15876.1 aldehyde dehydrogenase family protein [Natronosporangium hydrolyticum]